MADIITNQYVPDYQVTPGEVLEDYLEGLGMTQAELAARTGLPQKMVNDIIKGKSPITPETALKLERSLGRPAHFWENLERQFQEDCMRIAEKKTLLGLTRFMNALATSCIWMLGYPMNCFHFL